MFLLLTVLLSFSDGVVKTVPSPSYPYGLAFDGENLWLSTSSTNSDWIWKLDTSDGAVLDSIPVPFIPGGTYYVKGLAFDGNYLWVFMDLPSANHPDKFYKVDTSDGSVISTFNSPVNNYIGGIAFAEGNIWLSQYHDLNILIGIDTVAGTPFDTIPAQGEQPMGLAYDGQYLWCAEDTGFGATRQEIYKFDPAAGIYTGDFIRNPDNSPRDMTWDGECLWLIGYNTRLIYRIDLQGGTPNIALSDSSIVFPQTAAGDTSYQTVNVSNTGTADLTVDSAYTGSPLIFPVSQLPVTIKPDSSVGLEFAFAPEAYGHFGFLGYILSNDPVDTALAVTFEGTGLYPQQHAELSSYFHDFGQVWVQPEGLTGWDLKIYNRGINGLTVDSFSVSPPFSLQFVQMPLVLLPDDSALVRVWFAPPGAGVWADSLRIFCDDPVNPLLSVALQGEGYAGNYSLGYMFWQYLVPDNPYTSYNDKKVEGLKRIGDVNGDGIEDLIVCTENYMTLCLNGASSGTADTFWSFNTGVDNNNTGSISLNGMFSAQKALQKAGDLNGDGIPDAVICTDGGNEHVYALSGADGDVIWSYGSDNNPYMGGFGSVDACRDFNGDGINDVAAVASSHQDGSGYKSVFLFNGATGDSLWRHYVNVAGQSSGYSVISIDDANGDGIADVVAGFGGDGNTKFARALSGADGSMLWQFNQTTSGAKELLELRINDSTPDVIIANYWSDIYRVDGETGSPVWHASIGGGTAGVIQIEKIDDVNGNGYDDILVANFSSASGIFCIDGEDGSVVWFMPTQDYRSYGVVAVSDIDGDGIQEALSGDQSGTIYLFSGSGDSLIFSLTLPSRVYTVENLGSIDGENGDEILVGLDNGQVFCFSTGEIATGIENPGSEILSEFSLFGNYPNPFRHFTGIALVLPQESSLSIEVFNPAGQKVDEVISRETVMPGRHVILYDGKKLAQGMYFYVVRAGTFRASSKMIKID
ncbi:VCBS repeat-containing protein [candidate division WOR-3 bacterium]|nr:VCBS repeat-containing protein [candidate division WOR-3 bacterium]